MNRSGSQLAWLQLVRLPNHFTALADVLAGYAYARGALQPTVQLPMLLATSWLLYAAGMVLNDLFDEAEDRQQRPFRPIPSGRISRRAAATAGWTLMGLGLLMGLGTSLSWQTDPPMRWGPACVALVLALLIVAYNAGLKATWLGPITMGLCRSANLALGMTAGIPTSVAGIFGLEPAGGVAALGMGIYVAGITIFAHDEADQPRRQLLWIGLGAVMAGLVLFALMPWFEPFASGARSLRFVQPFVWPVLVGLLAFAILRRGFAAALAARPAAVRVAVKQMILSIIVLDAALALAVAGPVAAVVILALLIPALGFGRLIYST